MGDPASPASGEQDFGTWVRPHWAAMSALARRLAGVSDWEDVLQESLSAAWRKRAQFDPHRGTPRNWLLAITADQAHKNRRRRRAAPLDGVEHAIPGNDAALSLDLERAIALLAPRQRLAVTLRYFLGLPVADVATVMGCAEGTAKSTLADARDRIRSLLGEDYR
ncbi:RNA polymerase sigma factor [Jatrophihabitans sp.]|uniref:RNA polymerase sigma factor n=1 Tax=Jatrophihabitans sp. TaxID=1932789 RepID=UPI002BB4D395|nr:RNA polymerase sigma factor [Jatrophihabitans sp.]